MGLGLCAFAGLGWGMVARGLWLAAGGAAAAPRRVVGGWCGVRLEGYVVYIDMGYVVGWGFVRRYGSRAGVKCGRE